MHATVGFGAPDRAVGALGDPVDPADVARRQLEAMAATRQPRKRALGGHPQSSLPVDGQVPCTQPWHAHGFPYRHPATLVQAHEAIEGRGPDRAVGRPGDRVHRSRRQPGRRRVMRGAITFDVTGDAVTKADPEATGWRGVQRGYTRW